MHYTALHEDLAKRAPTRCPDKDIAHVLDHPLAVFPITGSAGDEAEMYVGFNRDATSVLEVLVILGEPAGPLVIHADTARATYLRRLP